MKLAPMLGGINGANPSWLCWRNNKAWGIKWKFPWHKSLFLGQWYRITGGNNMATLSAAFPLKCLHLIKHFSRALWILTGCEICLKLHWIYLNGTNQISCCPSLTSGHLFSLFAVQETLDRKHFQQEGMRVHTSSVKGPPQVCAQTSCIVLSGDYHGHDVITRCVLKKAQTLTTALLRVNESVSVYFLCLCLSLWLQR